MRFPPAPEDGMEIFGEHDRRAQYTPDRLHRARRLHSGTPIRRDRLFETVERTLNPAAPLVEHGGIDHLRGYFGMPDQLLHLADVEPDFQEGGGKEWAHRMAANGL